MIGTRNLLVMAWLAFAGFGLGGAAAKEPFSLSAIQAKVRTDFGTVSHLGTEALAKLIGQDRVVLFDVREKSEFAVSRIAGAVRVDPGISRSGFLERLKRSIRSKAVVFYCSVGVRSSQLARRVQAALKARGAAAIHNLDGGIFRWHGERKPLTDHLGATPFVHPYDRRWGKLVAREKFKLFAPRQTR